MDKKKFERISARFRDTDDEDLQDLLFFAGRVLGDLESISAEVLRAEDRVQRMRIQKELRMLIGLEE